MSARLLLALAAVGSPSAGPAAEPPRDPWLWPFAADSIWNTPIGADAQYVPAGLGKAARVGVDVELLFRVPAGSPTRPVFGPKSWETRAGGTLRLPDVPIPDGLTVDDARPGYTPNNCAAFLLPDGRTVANLAPLCRIDPSGPVFGYVFDRTDLWGDGAAGSHGGSRLSALGGSLRKGELVGPGPIRHALKVDIFCAKYGYYGPDRKGFRWPATGSDGYAGKGYKGTNKAVVMGSLLAIPPAATADRLGLRTAAGRKLFAALRDYGAYVVDDAAWDCHYLCAEDGVREEVEKRTGDKLEADRGPLFADINALFAALAVVDNNAPVAVGGGGPPRVPPAPPLPEPTPDVLKAVVAAAPVPAPPAPFPANGSMTAGTAVPDGWNNKWEGQGKVALSRDTATYKVGPAALAVKAVGGRAQGQAQQFHDAGSGAVVRFAGYLKTAGGITATAGVMSYTTDWKGIGFQPLDQSVNGADWHPFAGTVKLPDGTAHFAYTLSVEGDGTAWLDEAAGDAAAYNALAAAAKTAPRPAAGPHPDTPPKAPNAWTAGEGFYPAYPKAWRLFHTGFVERAKKGDADLVFFGDSITQGLAEQKALWAKYYAPRKAVDFGIGGDGTPQILWRLDHGTVDGLRPKAVVLMIGTNNRWRGDATPDTITKGVSAVVAKLREKLPAAKVLVLGVFPTGLEADHPDRKLFQETNQRLSKLADGKGVFFLDVTDQFVLPSGVLDKSAMDKDLLHLSAEGYKRWAAAMEPTLRKLMSEE